MTNQPRPILKALTPAILTQLVNAILGVLTAFNVMTLTVEQWGAIAVLLSVVGLFLTALGILSGENQSTPVESPVLPKGTDVTVQTPKGEPNETVTL